MITTQAAASSRPFPPTEPPFLRLTGICKRFGGLDALRDVDLDVRSGEVLALLGDNGRERRRS
jgi:ABC-type sugar transport system ATPase subunit